MIYEQQVANKKEEGRSKKLLVESRKQQVASSKNQELKKLEANRKWLTASSKKQEEKEIKTKQEASLKY